MLNLKVVSILIISFLISSEAKDKFTEIRLDAPYNVEVANATSLGQNPHVTWDARGPLTGFKVYRKIVGLDASFVHVATTTSYSYTDYCLEIDYGFPDDTVVWYKIKSVSGTVESGFSNGASAYVVIVCS